MDGGKFNLTDSKTAFNSNVEGQCIRKIKELDPRMENRPNRALVGSLLYIAFGSRPDIAFAVCQLCRHL